MHICTCTRNTVNPLFRLQCYLTYNPNLQQFSCICHFFNLAETAGTRIFSSERCQQDIKEFLMLPPLLLASVHLLLALIFVIIVNLLLIKIKIHCNVIISIKYCLISLKQEPTFYLRVIPYSFDAFYLLLFFSWPRPHDFILFVALIIDILFPPSPQFTCTNSPVKTCGEVGLWVSVFAIISHRVLQGFCQ